MLKMTDEYKDALISRLAENLSAMMDFAGERCGGMIGFRQAYREANNVCVEAYIYMSPAEEAEHYAELDRGYNQDRI